MIHSKQPQALQKRRANVQRQLEFWHAPHRPSQKMDIWEGLGHQERANIITALARLISKVVHPEDLEETQENKHER
jgi:hypothetical protein